MDQTGVSLIEESWALLSVREKQVLLDVFLMDGHHHKAHLGAFAGIGNGQTSREAANVDQLECWGCCSALFLLIPDISIIFYNDDYNAYVGGSTG